MARLSDLPELLRRSDWPVAEKLLRREAAKRNCPASVYYNLAKVLEVSGKVQQVGAWLKRAVACDPHYAMAWHELGRWHLAGGRLAEAYHAMDTAYGLDPADGDTRLALARLSLRLGHWQAAESLWSTIDGHEAEMARYRIAVETGRDATTLMNRLLRDKPRRPEVLMTLTRTAKGCIPLKIN